MQTPPHHSAVFYVKDVGKIAMGSSPTGAPNTGE